MYKLLVVDDEEIIRKGIISRILHYMPDFAQMWEASDGVEALVVIKEQQPDIVITDIKMPHMDGLQLIRQVREAGSTAKFIIISGYAEFEYAEQAINMGVNGYILKPVIDRELVKSLNNVMGDLDKEKNSKDIKNRTEILEKQYKLIENEKNINQLLNMAKADIVKGQEKEIPIPALLPETCEGTQFMLAILNIDGSSYSDSSFQYRDIELIKDSMANILNELECQCQRLIVNNYRDKNQVFVLLMNVDRTFLKACMDKYISVVFSSLAKFLGISVTIGISMPEDSISSELYRQARTAFEQRIVFGGNHVYKYENLPIYKDFNIPNNEIRLLQNCIERMDVGNIETILREIFSEKNFKGAAAVNIRLVWMEIVNMLLKVCAKMKDDVDNIHNFYLLGEEVLEKFNSLDEIVSYLYTTIIDTLKLEKAVDMNCSNKIKLVTQYIGQHYGEDININELSYLYAMNPNYFSTVFKKETGKTVVNYITEVRISNACRLLTETKASIADISQSVGYQDTQYFFRVFKKTTGKTPLEFRRSE